VYPSLGDLIAEKKWQKSVTINILQRSGFPYYAYIKNEERKIKNTMQTYYSIAVLFLME
jgi:phosphoribosyl-dephospho-CoA transferase